jgi:hypothetical protein
VIICTAGVPETSNWEQLSFVSGKVGQVAAWGTTVLGEIFCSIKNDDQAWFIRELCGFGPVRRAREAKLHSRAFPIVNSRAVLLRPQLIA